MSVRKTLAVLAAVAVAGAPTAAALVPANAEPPAGTVPRTIDLVVTDYAMPGMTGLQLANAIAAERPETVILLSTGYADLPSDTRSSLPRLAKPFDQAALAKAIEAAMGEEEPAGSVVAFRPKSA